MLFGRATFITAFVALLALVSSSVAELVEGPSGTVQHVKRFQTSTRPDGATCQRTCPDLSPVQASWPGAPAVVEPNVRNGEGFPQWQAVTQCGYYIVYTPNGGTTSGTQVCLYYKDTGVLYGSLSGQGGCPPEAGPVVCTPAAAPAKRQLSKLEQVVQARQYRPARAGRPSIGEQ